jgi:hypothetical protein
LQGHFHSHWLDVLRARKGRQALQDHLALKDKQVLQAQLDPQALWVHPDPKVIQDRPPTNRNNDHRSKRCHRGRPVGGLNFIVAALWAQKRRPHQIFSFFVAVTKQF